MMSKRRNKLDTAGRTGRLLAIFIRLEAGASHPSASEQAPRREVGPPAGQFSEATFNVNLIPFLTLTPFLFGQTNQPNPEKIRSSGPKSREVRRKPT